MSIDMGRRIVQCEEKFETAWFGLKESAREGVSFQVQASNIKEPTHHAKYCRLPKRSLTTKLTKRSSKQWTLTVLKRIP